MALVAKDGKSIGNTNLIRESTNSNVSSPAPTFKTIKTDVHVAPAIRSSSSTSTSVIEGCEAKSTSAAAKAKAQTSVAQNHAKAKIESVASNVGAAEAPSGHQPVNNLLRTVNSSSSNSNIARSQVEAAIKELFSSVASFQPNGKDQIACREGDSIEVLQKHDSGWSYGRVYSEGTMAEGWFPSWLVGVKIDAHARSSQSAPIQKAEAVEAKPPIQRFPVQNAFSASDASQLSLAIGDLVEVIEQHPTGWTFGRLLSTDKEGWFPDWAGYAGAC